MEYNGIEFELGIRNTGGVAANFHRADREIDSAMRAHVRQTTEIMDSVWESLTPVDRAFMVNHRRIKITKGGLAFEAGWDAADFFGAGLEFYPFYQEFGTYKMAAQPSLGPAYQYVAPIFRDGMTDILRAAIARLGASGR